ncbi:hypothetical protein ETD96_25770 [Actinomadura geliboluensis]|uniref:IS30 family transposase n=1 Tax=Actinomadura geliboluensis TaxID=882440 RepID=A0A5S4GMP7_9ACTN|nr:hypothetical protein [Actinomadura geliboluensis]TMR34187.1 hypothetical protein ETD96_25770 [Actinomadura geliboluensis]
MPVDGLLRQYLGKSTDLRLLDENDLDRIAAELNDRPRRIHGYRAPSTVYADLCAKVDATTP